MEIAADDLMRVLQELYPRELAHAISETRARIAEKKLAELEGDESEPRARQQDE